MEKNCHECYHYHERLGICLEQCSPRFWQKVNQEEDCREWVECQYISFPWPDIIQAAKKKQWKAGKDKRGMGE